MAQSVTTVIEALARSLESAARYNPSDVVRPAAILWADHDSQWQPIVSQLRRLMPQLLSFGEYQPEQRTGPAIWLRCMIDGALEQPKIPDGAVPIVYLSGVNRQHLRSVQECPDLLKPLVELQYRGVCWTQKNGKDWTVEAFLVADEGGLGLDVARDGATRRAMLGALTELATTSVDRLQGKRLEAEDFDKLFSADPAKDVLLWLSDPEGMRSEWHGGRWSAFRSRCKAELNFDPDKDGALVAAEMLGKRAGAWEAVWERFSESPGLYPGMPALLSKAKPMELLLEPSSWPQDNEKAEAVLREALLTVTTVTPSEARDRILELGKSHGMRCSWVWAKLGRAPLARALAHLVTVAQRTTVNLGGSTAADMVNLYVNDGWRVDAAALDAMAAVTSAADVEALSRALNALYRPWLEAAAEHLQALIDKAPLPCSDHKGTADLLVDEDGLILFADGLRYDVAQRLVESMREKGRAVTLSTRWAGLPTVTATAKPAVSPIADKLEGLSLGEDFLPAVAASEKPLTTDRFRKLLSGAGYQYLSADETGDPSGRAWTEDGELDKLGHSLQGKLAGRIDEQVDLLLERIELLLDAGWNEIRVVTDHGWLWLPGGLPKVDLPKYLTASRWARCAAIEGGSKVEVPTVPWYWNAHERVAIAPGIACFGAGNEYAHGGMSLQESLIPVIRVTPGAGAAKVVVTIVDIKWAGLRCRVRVDSTQSGLSVDLRTKINDPDSSVSKVRPVDAKGAASLLVADDELEGTPAVAVVLDAGGHVIVKQPTIVGG